MITTEYKNQLIEKIRNTDDERILKAIERCLSPLEDHSITEAEMQSIEQGIQDADAGKLHPHSAAQKLYEKWL